MNATAMETTEIHAALDRLWEIVVHACDDITELNNELRRRETVTKPRESER